MIVKHAECSKQVYGPKCTYAHSTIWKHPLSFPLSLLLIHKLALSLARPKYLKPFIVDINTLAYAQAHAIYFEKTKTNISASATLTTKICYISTFGTIIFTFSFADIQNFINDFFLFDFSLWFFFSFLLCVFWKEKKSNSMRTFQPYGNFTMNGYIRRFSFEIYHLVQWGHRCHSMALFISFYLWQCLCLSTFTC